MFKKIAYILVIIFSLVLLYCNPSDNNKNQDELIIGLIGIQGNGQRNLSTKELAWESNEDYNVNTYGIITSQTLKKYLEDWKANKPTHISGKLVVLQNTTTVPSWGYLKGDGENTFVYAFDFGSQIDGFIQTRNNGVVSTQAIIPDGERLDNILNLYGIDPLKDLVVFASTSPVESHYMTTLRGFYAFYYWGFDKRNLAVLNGTLASSQIRNGLPTHSSPNVPPALDNKYSVRQLKKNHFILQLTLEETKRAVSNPIQHNIQYVSGGIFVSDARSKAEYDGIASAGGAYHPISNPNAIGPAQPDTRYLGTLKGAKHTPWQIFLTGAPNHAFKSKEELKAIYNGLNYNLGDTIIHLCRTNYRAQITGFATLAILGYPTTYYDGGWIEWGNLVAGGVNPTLPSQSPYRTDLPEYTDNGNYNPNANSTPLPEGLNVFATTSRQIILDDIQYKRSK